MDKNNAFMELQSNFKRAQIETDLTNLHVNPCSRKKKNLTTILVILTKSEKYISKKDIVNQLTMVLYKHNLKKFGVILSNYLSLFCLLYFLIFLINFYST
jgi:hypothetical protein